MDAGLLDLNETAEEMNAVAGYNLTDAKKLCRWRDAGEGPALLKIAGRYYSTRCAREEWYERVGLKGLVDSD